MIRGLVLRAVALVAVAGQLQVLPAAMACAAEHRKPVAGHCGDGGARDGVAVTTNHDAPVSPLCVLGVGCRASTAGLMSPAGASGLAPGVSDVPADAPLPPASLDPSPTPPPPQA